MTVRSIEWTNLNVSDFGVGKTPKKINFEFKSDKSTMFNVTIDSSSQSEQIIRSAEHSQVHNPISIG